MNLPVLGQEAASSSGSIRPSTDDPLFGGADPALVPVKEWEWYRKADHGCGVIALPQLSNATAKFDVRNAFGPFHFKGCLAPFQFDPAL